MLSNVDACPVNRIIQRSLQINRNNDEDFKTNSKEIINNCQLYFGVPPIADAIKNDKLTP